MKLGQVVGVGLLLGAAGCFSWGSRAGRHLPATTALESTYAYRGDVIIVGAGAAGLAAARVLEDNDVPYTILEATSRYGGRLAEDVEFADFPIDLGAEWIHNQAEVLDVLSGEAGASGAADLVPYHLTSGGRWDGESYGVVAAKELDRRFAFFPEYKFRRSTWFDFVRTHYGDRVEHRIVYDSPVVAIDYREDRVGVTLAGGERLEADKVLVTVSIGVLQGDLIRFDPPMSEKKRKAIEEVEFHQGFKLFLKFSHSFYPDAILCEGEKSYWDVAFGKGAQDHVLGLLAKGDAAEAYYRLGSQKAVVESVLAELDLMFEGAASEAYTGDTLFLDWGHEDYILGTWVEGFRLSKSAIKRLNEPLEEKVYFAGEVYDPYRQLGVPGAILSGFDAVDRLLNGKR